MRQLRWFVALLMVLAFVGTACGDDDDDDTVGSPDTTADDSSTAPPEYTITASDADGTYAFDVPDDIKGGAVTISLDNKGGKELHDFQLVKLDGHDLDELTKQLADDSHAARPATATPSASPAKHRSRPRSRRR